MVSLFLRINRVLAAHRQLTAAVVLLLVALFATLALRLDYEEDIAKFLPVKEQRQAYQEAVEQLTSQNRIVIVFTGQTDSVKQAMDCFENRFAEADTAHIVGDLQVTADETKMLDMLTFVSENAPYFLTADDYSRMDSLLADDHFIGNQLAQDKHLLLLPTGGLTTQTLAQDPLHLFTPAIERLQAIGSNSRFTVDDGYIFTREDLTSDETPQNSRHGLAFLTSPYGMSESAGNAALTAMIDRAMSLTENDCPSVKVSAVGGPLIAVSNATQIKRDSMLAIAIAVTLILALLIWHYRRLSYLLWIAAALGFGWLMAVGCMSLIRGSMSVIVLGIGSVIIGIAVNYPLHYLDHLKETGDPHQTLCDMVKPLLIGNITTFSAFLCLLWLDAAAMRDLGLFGALMLIGTVLFVLVVMPVFLRGEVRGARYENSMLQKERERDNLAPRTSYLTPRKTSPRKLFAILLLLITIVLGYFSLQTSFDSDLRHINYMTGSQREDMELLASLSEDIPQEMAQMIPSVEVQQERQQLWNAFRERHKGLAEAIKKEAVSQGFKSNAFNPFFTTISQELELQPATYFEPVGSFLGDQHLLNAKNVGAELVEILQDNFNYVSLVCGFVVFFFLWLSFGSIELALLSFLPLAVGWIWILGLMQLTGIQFNIVNIILATFIFGQGDDYTIFITEGLAYEYATGRRRLASYRRSVMLSAVLMFIGIGTLILAKHPALRSLAEVTIIGMGTVVLMANYLPPLVFRWLVRGKAKPIIPSPAVSGQEVSKTICQPLPITLKRVAYSLFAIGFFLTMMYLFVLPYTWLYFHLGKATEERKLKYHGLLQELSDFVIHHVPGVKYYMENRLGETFDCPAVIISNHQSHLDLMCLMMLTPRIVFLTNDWVWNNPFYGMVIHRAEFYPVSNGIENHLEQLRQLYERGYSICVFPEGTRSEDCSIRRFHQGAFFLAGQLGADILPIYLHGVGHVLPKRDFLLREGRIDVEVGRRIPFGEWHPTNGQQLLAFTREMRHHYQEHYQQMCEAIENDDYWKPYRKYTETYEA